MAGSSTTAVSNYDGGPSYHYDVNGDGFLDLIYRSGTTWYLGAMTNETARTLSIPLSFLGSGTYTATIYADGTPASSPYQTPVVVSTRTVTSSTTLSVAMAPAGGQAVVLSKV